MTKLTRPSHLLRNRNRTSKAGMSLVETMYAIAVIAIGLLGIMAIFIAGNRANTMGRHTAEAAGHAREILEIIRSRNLAFTSGLAYPPGPGTGLNDADGVKRDLNEALPLALGTLENVDMYKRHITTTKPSEDYLKENNKALYCTVTISWYDLPLIVDEGSPVSSGKMIERTVSVSSLLVRAGYNESGATP